MSWKKVRLGDICTKIGSGATPKGGAGVYAEKGTAFIRSQNVYNLSFDYDGLVYINDEMALKLNGVAIEENDILLNITGDSVARTCIVPRELIPARVNQHVVIVRPNSAILNPLFLNYYLASPFMQSFMLGLAVGKGTSRNAMTKDMIANFEVPCPSIEIQEEIVKMISPYTILIENNQKQIKLLEEAAQRLYKEWFIDLKFPGYEDCKIVDGVPEEWRRCKVTDFLEIKYGKDHKALEDGDIPVYGSGGIMRKVKPIIYSGESVLIPRKGSLNNIMYVTGNFWTIDTMFFSKPRIENIIKYTYLFLKRLDMYSFNIGAAVPSMTVKILDEIDILQPDKETLSKFERIINPIFMMSGVLKAQIEKMQQARDGLLPKLMNGKMEV